GLERLRNLKTLAEVDLRYTRATRAGVDALQKSVPGAKLIFLDTGARVSIPRGVNEHVNGKGDAAVAAWIRAVGGSAVLEGGRLVEASLAATPVTDEQLENLSGAVRLGKLDLEATEGGHLGIPPLGALPGLRELSLNSTSISDAGLQHLATLRSLSRLSLNNTYVEGAGFAQLPSLTQLEELSVAGSPVPDAGAAAIARFSSLKRLSLAWTDITDAGASSLAALGALASL